MKKKCSFIFLCFLAFFCLSCVSTNLPAGFKKVTSFSELTGTWASSHGEWEYPFELDGKKYLRYAYAATDDTQIWFDYAEQSGRSMEELWKKRFAIQNDIYSEKSPFPYSDANGTQIGRKLFVSNERIYSRVEILIPERIVAINFDFFVISKDGFILREHGLFHFASDIFTDSDADDEPYIKTAEQSK